MWIYEEVWLCPSCGQWGRDEFGEHRRPYAAAFEDVKLCEEQPVVVNLRPFLERRDSVASSV